MSDLDESIDSYAYKWFQNTANKSLQCLCIDKILCFLGKAIERRLSHAILREVQGGFIYAIIFNPNNFFYIDKLYFFPKLNTNPVEI